MLTVVLAGTALVRCRCCYNVLLRITFWVKNYDVVFPFGDLLACRGIPSIGKKHQLGMENGCRCYCISTDSELGDAKSMAWTFSALMTQKLLLSPQPHF